ncbi:hypothetical protein HGA13_26445 [Nocardia speluncae]|uniref:Uncharacterized protein n=1 Tax=Nocardia speluncae TaxID=419477 RepID=A0A846XPY7_9NOCA|nr:hypothetical protein [Nocardia speluncae]NKY36583.1 hypothetical protein [Nocardia speluncae]
MTASQTLDTRVPARAGVEVDIAGTCWPVYKLEALGAGLLSFLAVALVLGSLQAGVLLSTAVCAVLWTLGWWRTAR